MKNSKLKPICGGSNTAQGVQIDVERYVNQGAPVLAEFFGDAKPVSTTVEVSRLVHPDWLVEIKATAVID
jgi:enamine deaminase RidA (YjgF/YER057c/UK114 family)